ncbi:unnamed protein product [Trifolium pratense]|nr:unnamed protein product [Trifolium pratense]
MDTDDGSSKKPPDQHGHNSSRPAVSFRDMVMGQQQVTAPQPKKDLFAANLAKIQYEEGDPARPMVHIADSVFENLCSPWKDALVVKLLGKKLGFNTMKDRLTKVWKLTSDFDIMDINNGFFMVKFDLEADRLKVMDGGPWMVFDRYLSVQSWSADFVSPTAKIDRTMVWIRFPGLNLVFYDESVLLALGAAVGTPVKVDRNTLDVKRGRFARVCVEIDLNKPVIGKVWIKGHWYKVEYEGLHRICTNCGCYGHLGRDCKKPSTSSVASGAVSIPEQQPAAPNTPLPTTINADVPLHDQRANFQEKINEPVPRANDEALYGDWLMVKRKQRKAKNTSKAENMVDNKKKSVESKELKEKNHTSGPSNSSHSKQGHVKGAFDLQSNSTLQPTVVKHKRQRQGNIKDMGPQHVNHKPPIHTSTQHDNVKDPYMHVNNNHNIINNIPATAIYGLGNNIKSNLDLKDGSNSRFELLQNDDEIVSQLVGNSSMVPGTHPPIDSMAT